MKLKPTTLREDIRMAIKLFRPHWDGGYQNATYRDMEIVVAMIEKLYKKTNEPISKRAHNRRSS